ncbi:MAG: hypothetical protein KA436_06695 [Oligoflexales bacterium]|nr:hypothetical protein [Oligoflexales bacterium]
MDNHKLRLRHHMKMSEKIKQSLEEANKFIFVKKYAKAASLLDDMIQSEEGKDNLLLHLRRIELALKLKDIERLREDYAPTERGGKFEMNPTAKVIARALADQHSEFLPPAEIILCFEKILQEHGEHPAAYFGLALSLESQGNFERSFLNYQRSIQQDPDWFPSYFGMSQICYHFKDLDQGDHYFYLFEQYAPYNLYGNFETHRNLSREFLKKKYFDEAETAVRSLTEWWSQTKGECPAELQTNEAFCLANISALRGDVERSEAFQKKGLQLTGFILESSLAPDDTLYFVAKILEEFSENEMAFEFYRKILSKAQIDAGMVQKIGSQFLSLVDTLPAKILFFEAYNANPDHVDVRFCFLVAKLKVAKLNVEDYLLAKEKLKKIFESSRDPVELLSLVQNLLAKFQEDPDIQSYAGDLYLDFGNLEKAKNFYKKMILIDPLGQVSLLKYSSFLVDHDGDLGEVEAVLNRFKVGEGKDQERYIEYCWLRSRFYGKLKKFEMALECVHKVLKNDPWNVSYIAHEIFLKISLIYGEESEERIDPVLLQILSNKKGDVAWDSFDQVTKKLRNDYRYDLVYSRCKLRFLFSDGEERHLYGMVEAVCRYDASLGIYELLRLLNTNFDSPRIYLGLGILFKSLHQMETACMWFEQSLLYTVLAPSLQARAYLELADAYVWRNIHLDKAIAYAKLSLELDARLQNNVYLLLTHGYLKLGKSKEARDSLNLVHKQLNSFEHSYLEGLLSYRNGSVDQAKKIWKSLLSLKTEDLRSHHIKQEILRYYFESESYLKAL